MVKNKIINNAYLVTQNMSVTNRHCIYPKRKTTVNGVINSRRPNMMTNRRSGRFGDRGIQELE